MQLNEICGELSSEQAIAPPGELRDPTFPWKRVSSCAPAILLQKTLRRILACTLPRAVMPAPLPTSVLLLQIKLLLTYAREPESNAIPAPSCAICLPNPSPI